MAHRIQLCRLAVLLTLASPVAALADDPPAVIPLVDPTWSELVPGARVRVLVTLGDPSKRTTRTVDPACVEVQEVTAAGARLALPPDVVRILSRGEKGVEVRLAACRSDATPLAAALAPDAYAMALPPSLPRSITHLAQPGDRVDVLVSLPAYGSEEDQTFTMLTGIELVGPRRGPLAMVLTAEQAEKYAHALSGASIVMTIERTPTDHPEAADRLSEIVPEGLVIAGAPLPARMGLQGFLAGGDYLDVLVDVSGRLAPVLQAVFTMYPLPIVHEPVTSIGILATPEQAEQLAHASTFLPTGYALRNPEDTAFVEPGAEGVAAPAPQPDRVTRPVSARIAMGMRGVDVPWSGATAPVVGARGAPSAPAAARRPRGAPSARRTARDPRAASAWPPAPPAPSRSAAAARTTGCRRRARSGCTTRAWCPRAPRAAPA